MSRDEPEGGPASAPARLPHVDPARCTGCGRCVAVCTPHVLSLQVVAWRKRAVLDDPQRCTACSDCAVVCPFLAIRMRRATVPIASAQSPGDASATDR